MVVGRVGRKPLLVEDNSSRADVFGVAVPIPTLPAASRVILVVVEVAPDTVLVV